MISNKARTLSLILTLPITLGLLTATPAHAATKPIKSQLNTKQVDLNLLTSWRYSKIKPTKQLLTIKEAGKIILTKSIPAKDRSYIFKGLAVDKKYSVTLTSTKPNIILNSSITLTSLPKTNITLPKTPQQLGISRSGNIATITWSAANDNVESYEIVALGSNGEKIEKTISAPITTYHLENISTKVSYTLSIRAKNTIGYSPTASIRLIYEDTTLLPGLNNRIIGSSFAEKILGTGTLTMRPAAGAVDLEDPAQASQNLVMSLLHNCLTTTPGKNVDQATLPNLGALFALRSPKDTLLLTSGAMGIENIDGAQWLSENQSIESCVTNPLTTQLHNVATALSPLATVSKTSVINLPITIPGRKSALATGSVTLGSGDLASVEQPLQILWVGVGSGNYLSQYILIRFGATIDDTLINLLNSEISQAIIS